MKSKVFTLLIVLIGLAQSVFPCTVEIEPYRKTFRRAQSVFLAEVTSIEPLSEVDYNKSFVDGKISFRIENTWKGRYQKNVNLRGNIGFSCGCNSYDQFKIGAKYIVVVDKKSTANFCDATKIDTKHSEKIADDLDSFWFRTWSRIYPF